MKLAIFDIDGTLVSFRTHMIADGTKKAINKLKERGIKTAIATGRQYLAIPKEIKDLEMEYYLCANGSMICDSNGKVLCSQIINDKLIESLTKDFIKYHYPLALRYPSGTLEVNPNNSVLKYSRFFFSEEQFEIVKKYILTEQPENETVYACLGHIEEGLLEELTWKYPELLFVITGGGKLCDITLKGMNKGKGLQTLCKHLNIDTMDCIAFGDDANDIEMIEIAGIGVAMGNALQIVKEQADYVTDSCENLGVAKALKYYDLI